MITDFCTALRRELKETVAARLTELERGRGSREADEKLRGELWGLRTAMDAVDELEARARHADSDDIL